MPSDHTQDEELARLIRLGATTVSDRRPDVGWVIMADPEGNEFCVNSPGRLRDKMLPFYRAWLAPRQRRLGPGEDRLVVARHPDGGAVPGQLAELVDDGSRRRIDEASE